MTIETLEQEVFGAPLTPMERAIGGVIAVFGAVGHIVLGVAAAVFFATLLFGL